jgi:hypothetical protein
VNATLAVYFILFYVFLQAHYTWHLTHTAVENAALGAAAEVHCEGAIESAEGHDDDVHVCHQCLICTICTSAFNNGLQDRGICIAKSRQSIIPLDYISELVWLFPFYYLRAPPIN